MTDTSADAPLNNVRVLDLGCYLAGPLAGMLLTDQGADTVKIDPPGGPRFDHPVNAVLNRGKTRRWLDGTTEAGTRRLERLIRGADVLIENFSPPVMEQLGLPEHQLQELNPDLITVSLPGYASEERATDAFEGTIAAATGQYTDIHPTRNLLGLDPVYTALPIASVYAAVHAATATVLALRERASGGGAARIEAPLASAALSAMSSIYLDVEDQPDRYDAPRLSPVLRRLVLPLVRAWTTRGSDARQQQMLTFARRFYPALMTSYRCRDDRLLYVFAVDNRRVARSLLEELEILESLLEEGLTFADPYAEDRSDNLSEGSNLSRGWQSRLKTRIAEVLATRPAEEWEEHLHAAGVPCAVQRTTRQWLDRRELKAAGLVASVEDPDLGPMLQPGPLAWLSESPSTPDPREQVDAVGGEDQAQSWPSRSTSNGEPDAPSSSKKHASAWLEGLTVIDLCSMVAGPTAGRTLAEYGARVIKIGAPDPNHGPRLTCWYGLDVNQGKESVLLDLSTEDGRKALDGLLAEADVLLTNHMPEAMARMGLSEAEVRAIAPDVVYCNLKTYNGPDGGPWADRPSYDPVLQAASGIMRRYGDDDHPELHAIASCVDALTGYAATFGMALALLKRSRNGEGARVGTSLAAAATLVQLPYAFSYDGKTATEASGQIAKGEGPLYRLYRAQDGWLFLAAPNADAHSLPPSIRPDDALNGDDLASWIADRVQSVPREEAISRFTDAGMTAVPVCDVDQRRDDLLGRPEDTSLRLTRRSVPGVGPVVSVPPLQTRVNGESLDVLASAEKPGASTRSVLKEVGADADHLLEKGVAVPALSDEYLPS